MISKNVLDALTAPFFSEDPKRPLYVAECCGRVYVGPVAPTSCRTCPNIPQYEVISSIT